MIKGQKCRFCSMDSKPRDKCRRGGKKSYIQIGQCLSDNEVNLVDSVTIILKNDYKRAFYLRHRFNMCSGIMNSVEPRMVARLVGRADAKHPPSAAQGRSSNSKQHLDSFMNLGVYEKEKNCADSCEETEHMDDEVTKDSDS